MAVPHHKPTAVLSILHLKHIHTQPAQPIMCQGKMCINYHWTLAVYHFTEQNRCSDLKLLGPFITCVVHTRTVKSLFLIKATNKGGDEKYSLPVQASFLQSVCLFNDPMQQTIVQMVDSAQTHRHTDTHIHTHTHSLFKLYLWMEMGTITEERVLLSHKGPITYRPRGFSWKCL